MLNDRARVILFWFTMSMILVVVAVAVVTILRAWGGSVAAEPPPQIAPAEISLCTGERRQFTVADAEERPVTWTATGGTIGEDGQFLAGDTPGEYVVAAGWQDARQRTEAVVYVVACTPTPTVVPTMTPIPAPTLTPTPQETPPPVDDARNDVGTYDAGLAVDDAPQGVDIQAANIAPDLSVALDPTAGVPEELAGWVRPGEAVLWISLYEPIPDPPNVYTEWLFSLDLDGNVETGRPAGAVRVNPDLGDEVVLGLSFDPAINELVPYMLVWDAAQGDWSTGPAEVRFTLNDARTLVALAVPQETLEQVVRQTSGVDLAPDAARGRAAVLSYVGEQAVIDFYPERPE
jgi:hypothetical protein